jgi:hypothetical protein
MKFKPSSNRLRGRYALIALLLLFAFIPFALSGCGGGGSGSSGSYNGASATPNSTGGVNLSQNYTVSGTVTGGSENIPSGTVTLYVLNTNNGSYISTGDTGTINNGSYTISYTGGTSYEYFMVSATAPSGNMMYNIALGSFGIPNVTMNINELTTAQAVYAYIYYGGTMSASSPGSLPFGQVSDYSFMYNFLPLGSSNTYTAGFASGLISPMIPAVADNEIEESADALASCVQHTSYCSGITGNISGYTAGTGTLTYNLMENNASNMQTSSMQTALNNLITNVASLSLPWSTPTTTTSPTTTPTT